MKKIAVLVAEGFEEIETVTPADILKRGGVEVLLAGVTGMVVEGSHGIKLSCDISVDALLPAEYDGVVIPGGIPGANNIAASSAASEFINSMHLSGKMVAAICASPAVVLSPTGILDGKKATGYPGSRFDPGANVEVVTDRVVLDGSVITGIGAGGAAEFGLSILEYLEGKDTAASVASKMLYKNNS